MNARDAILRNLRQRLGADDAARAARVEERLAARQRHLIPARTAGLDRAGLIDLFIGQNAALATEVIRLPAVQDAPRAVARTLAGLNMPARIKIAPSLAHLPWADTGLETQAGAAQDADLVGMTAAQAGIAETGTLMTWSGVDAPTALNFLPDLHFVLLREGDVVATYEDAIDRMRARLNNAMPRSLNFITGPSRTADIEQTIVLGAHGPRRLCILLAP